MKKENVKGLRNAIAYFCNSSIILSSAPISNLLKFITDTPDFLGIVQESVKLTNFQIEFRRATSTNSDNSLFSLPNSDYKIVSLVTGILFEFDNGTTSIINFVSSYFPSISPQNSFELFCKSIMLPYENSLLRIYHDIEVKENEPSTPPLIETQLYDKVKEESQEILDHMLDKLSRDVSLTDGLRNEATKMIKGVLYSFEFNNTLLLDYMMVGFSRFFSSLPGYNKELSMLKSIFKRYGIIQ